MLTAKLVVTLTVAAVGGVAVAVAAGGVARLAANQAGVSIDEGLLAGELFGAIPAWIGGRHKSPDCLTVHL